MTKEQYVRHIEGVSGLLRPSAENGCMADQWREAQKKHMAECPDCKECKERRKTKRASYNAKVKHQIMVDMGLTRVRGALGGVYYE